MNNHAQHTYRSLLVMAVLSFISMYVLMYAMVDRFANVYASVNQVYMAGLMAAPMVIIELLVMRPMYQDTRLNVALIAGTTMALIAIYVLIRSQAGVADRQFLRSMIPHHAGAILMCDKASLSDPDLRELCKKIREGQQAEIDQMKAKLSTLPR